MSFLSPIHIVFFAAIALLVLGPKRFPEFTRTLGNGLREFRAVMSSATVTAEPPPAAVAAEPAEAPPLVAEAQPLVAATVEAGPADAAHAESPQA